MKRGRGDEIPGLVGVSPKGFAKEFFDFHCCDMMSQNFLLNSTNGDYWPVTDPVAWCLENRSQPILEQAATGLLNLTLEDRDRIVRLVVRRCRLHFISVRPSEVAIHYWVKQTDLRPWFKKHSLARRDMSVALLERKHEVFTITNGAAFLYGDPASHSFTAIYEDKWGKRLDEEPDDWNPAWSSWSNFCWSGVEPGRIPWAVLKVAWRQERHLCPNCDLPMFVYQFGMWRATIFNQYPRFRYLCLVCQRHFRGPENWQVEEWLAANLTEEVMPTFKRNFWGVPEPWYPKR